jgi:copper chaperone CopZ
MNPTIREAAVMASETFTVEQIHCEACEATIGKALTRVDGVRQLEADATSNQVTVLFDENAVGVEQIVARLSDAGFPVVT